MHTNTSMHTHTHTYRENSTSLSLIPSQMFLRLMLVGGGVQKHTPILNVFS